MNEDKQAKREQQYEEWVEWGALRDRAQRTKFDYQERWHGWRSPVGLNLGFALFALGVLLLSWAFAPLFS